MRKKRTAQTYFHNTKAIDEYGLFSFNDTTFYVMGQHTSWHGIDSGSVTNDKQLSGGVTTIGAGADILLKRLPTRC